MSLRRHRAAGPSRRGTLRPGGFHPARQRGGFRPPHCPNRNCVFYQPSPDWRVGFWGFYRSPASRRPLQRLRCRSCKRTFTARTFSADYWLHHRAAFIPVARASVAGSGLRQTARSFRLSHATVGRHLARAGRLCLVFHRKMVRSARRCPSEPFAFDGFETFEYSQFFPCHLNLAVGARSWMVYHFTHSPLRRKGSMTREQKSRRAELESALGRPDPKAVENGIFELLRQTVELRHPSPDPAVVFSDDHPAYLRALRRLRRDPDLPELVHRTTPGRAARTRANPLFPVNLTDLLLRHCGANHRRETIAFSKRVQGALERLAIFTVWRNAIKPRREKKPGETAAMAAGYLSGPLRWREVLRIRQFPRKSELPAPWWEYYWGRIHTAALGPRQRENRATYAF